MLKVFFLLLLSCVYVFGLPQAQGGKNLDQLIGEIYSTPGTKAPVVVTTSTQVPNLQPNSGGDGGGLPGIGSDCTCVPFYLCRNGSINTNGEGIIDIRIDEKEGPCGSVLEFCCKKEDQTTEPITQKPPVHRTGCGHRNAQGIGFRITGKDNEAQYGEFPWMVAILREETVEGNPQKLNVYQCGGALINSRVVVTAAHCVNDRKKKFKIRAGEWDTQTTKEMFPHQDREVSNIIVHPQYYAGALYNDIALLFLETPVDIAENVNVVCLPPQGAVSDHSRCFASGWGKDVFGKEGKYQVILKKIELPVVPTNSCQNRLRETRLGKFFELHKSFICAGGEPNVDTCKGDGGSPLVCPINGETDRYFQAGIVAWGIGCGENNTPGVYVNVALFREWIDEQMKIKNLEVSTYNF